MTVFIGADHNGFELKDTLIEYLQEKNIRVEDMGNYEHDPEDDYPIFAKKVAQAVLQNPEEFRGIVICGSGIGVAIAANRHKGIRCGVCLSPEAAKHGRENDHINMLSLAAEYTSPDAAKEIVDTFLQTAQKPLEKYIRRGKQLDE